MEVLSFSESQVVTGGWSTFEITFSTTIWGALLSVWKNNPSWLLCGLLSGIVLSAARVVDEKIGFNSEQTIVDPTINTE